MKRVRFISALLLVLAIISCFVGCDNGNELDKTVLTPDQFMDIMVAEGYNIYDITAQTTDFEDIETVYAATTGEELYQIEFIKMADEESAEALFTGNKVGLEQYKEENAYIDYDLSLANFSTYKITVVERYVVVSRVEDTLIFINAPEEFKDEIDRIVSLLGY